MNVLLFVGIGFFLLVVGILLGRLYIPDRRPLERTAEEGRHYIRGLLDVLEGDTQGAVDEITHSLRGSRGMAEAYLALGALFRQRGELERAVRVHQALLLRRDLAKEHRLKACHELAVDFRTAGFPRRAIKALEWMVAKDKKHAQAWRELADLYHQEGLLERAALVQRRLHRLTGEDTRRIQAHLWAALASRQLAEGALDRAGQSLRRAIAACPESVHGLHVLAQLQQQRGRTDAAIKVWTLAMTRAPDLAGFFLPFLERCFPDETRGEQVRPLVETLLDQAPGNAQVRLAQARYLKKQDPRAALEVLTQLLDDFPTLLPARREAAALIIEKGDPDRVRQALLQILHLLAQADRRYRCSACGRADDELFWCCPGCGAWDTARVAWGRRQGEQVLPKTADQG